MGVLLLCVTFLTLLFLRNWVYSAGCPYEDTVPNCISVLCPHYPNPAECCFTCGTTTAITTTSTTTTTTTATATTTPSPAENITTGTTSQATSTLSRSAGVIAGAVVGSIAGASLVAVIIYAVVQYYKGTKLQRVIGSSTIHETIIEKTNDEISDENADAHIPEKIQVHYENGDILCKNKSLPPFEVKVSDLSPLPIILSKSPLLTTAKT